MSRTVSVVKNLLLKWSLALALLVLWELATLAAESPFFPRPTQIAASVFDVFLSGPASQLFLSETVFDDVLPSLGRIFGSWAIATVIGVALGTALGRSQTALDYIGPLLSFMRAVPPPALVPVFMVLFGIDNTMKVVTIVFGVIWPIILNTIDGVRSVGPLQQETARSFRTPRHYWITMVVLPAAMPKIFAGLRLSLSLALILMVIAEMVGTTNGIGFQLISAQQSFEFATMWTWIVLLGVLGYGLNTLLLALERRVLVWQPTNGTADTKTTGA
ncbi:MAG: ABC transporter permease [Saccharomonospora viridis]|jgi:ABC-type nitrate/sulfonate/bicarbonate transport system permease component|uniref:ABC-type nitrate/sulfonate/bicarbonate transport system, permease component n=1 Tax=Saccharomonospora viridis (strain ATCC 15386 / DSM 43017 / JCM 3036 / CCUG 5913 / NBRC 12207 / NCIMB 9602 / P101) TaxID=471857 RepID=C7N0J4_SACVD|nr:ABC transporter permease [Saccharomonospora viridis]ACU98396.1 ABC-type nitrate/sulfonate/bicarbonate transport system, permease component [Saccharomonospora viridis DSM 43017]